STSFLSCCRHPRDVPSFPTRRSSDLGYFASLALAHADAAIAITNHGQCSEAHGATTLDHLADAIDANHLFAQAVVFLLGGVPTLDRKSTRLNSSHVKISYAVFCLKKK